MKKLQKFLMLTVLVAILVGIGAIASSAAATMTPAKVLADFDGTQTMSASGGTQRCTVNVSSEGDNKYYQIDFVDSGANANASSVSGNYAFIGKGDYIVMEFDFMATDWSTVKNILVGWNSRNASGGALNDMHFSFSNDKGAPKITGNPLAGSIVLDPTPGVWHHFAMIVQIGGEHVVKSGGNLTAVQKQDAVEAYAYVDGQCFAKNLIGDGKEFWSKDTTFWQTFRMTATGGDQRLCIDNLRVVQYEATRELRDFFKYREKNDGELPDIHNVTYPFLAYDQNYDYPLGVPNCKVVDLSGNEKFFDRFDKAAKFASGVSGSKLILLADIANASVNYPVLVDRAGYSLDYSVSPNLRVDEKVIVNPITGAVSTEISFIKKTKYAYYQWKLDHIGETLDSRGYTPLAVGAPVEYSGNEFKKTYYRDGVLYTFQGQWYLDGAVLDVVPAYAVNSFYTLTPAFSSAEVYAIIENLNGGVEYVLSIEDLAGALENAPKDSIVTLTKDVELSSALTIKNRITLDLAGKTLSVNGADAAILLTDAAQGAVITSSEAGAQIVSTGVAFDAAAAFTVEGENLFVSATALLKASAAVRGVVVDGGVFVLDGDTVLVIGEDASLSAEIDAVIIAENAMVLADSEASYDLVLGGALSGVEIVGSEISSVTLSEGLLLSEASAMVDAELPQGVAFADASLVIAVKVTVAEYGDALCVTGYVVTDAAETVILAWEEDVQEYVMPGEAVWYGYSNYYDAQKFYTPNGTYTFKVDGASTIGNVASADWVGLTVEVTPLYDATTFFVAVAMPDGTYEVYAEAANLAALMSSGEYAAGTVFAIGQKNMVLENLLITKDYALDLNGYTLVVAGTNKIVGGSLTIYSSLGGASFYSDATQAFMVEDGSLVIDGENLSYLGTTLANLDATSALLINGGDYVMENGASFYKAESGAVVTVEDIRANAELFEAADGYEWIAMEENVTIGGRACTITVKLAESDV